MESAAHQASQRTADAWCFQGVGVGGARAVLPAVREARVTRVERMVRDALCVLCVCHVHRVKQVLLAVLCVCVC